MYQYPTTSLPSQIFVEPAGLWLFTATATDDAVCRNENLKRKINKYAAIPARQQKTKHNKQCKWDQAHRHGISIVFVCRANHLFTQMRIKKKTREKKIQHMYSPVKRLPHTFQTIKTVTQQMATPSNLTYECYICTCR